MERLTQWTPNGASLVLNNPKNDAEAREMLMQQFRKACNRLAELEDKLECGKMVEISEDKIKDGKVYVAREATFGTPTVAIEITEEEAKTLIANGVENDLDSCIVVE